MKNNIVYRNIIFTLLLFIAACKTAPIKQVKIGLGWANNSINTVKFRKNALTTFKDYQFTAYYNSDGFLVLGKRKLRSEHWEVFKTSYKGNVVDAHNSISIAVDGDGYLHVSWDHHNTKLRYAKSKQALGLEIDEEQLMTGKQESKVTYPEFYNLPNGNLLFLYRSGESGRGNMVINSYNLKTKQWKQIQQNLLDGENKRSAYWQACVDVKGTIHVSWVWRESWDVSTNHDLCYAQSKDGGVTWQKSTKEFYQLPIKLTTAEYAWKIPEKSSLINQTAITADKKGNPYIASYWSKNGVPQFQIVYLDNEIWKKEDTKFRKSNFYLGGGGTKKIPISRPDILIDDKGSNRLLYLLFRDKERGNKISLAYYDLRQKTDWKIIDLTTNSVGEWEPNYDVALWKNYRQLNIFAQKVSQIDGEGLAQKPPTPVTVLEINKLPQINE